MQEAGSMHSSSQTGFSVTQWKFMATVQIYTTQVGGSAHSSLPGFQQESKTLQHAPQAKQESCANPGAFFSQGEILWTVFAVLGALTYIANEVVSTVWLPSDHSQGLGHHEAVLEKQHRKHTADRQ